MALAAVDGILDVDFNYLSGQAQALPISKDEINIEYDISSINREVCNICLNKLEAEPKIRCAECENIVLCLHCFSLGLELQRHRCHHAYHIDRRHMPVDPDTNWTLNEDYELLQGLQECGYGNFTDLGKRLMHKTIDDIRIRIDELLGLNKASLRACLQLEPKPVIKFNAASYNEDPPRYPSQYNGRLAAGYCAPRGDFASEHANDAEEMLQNVGLDDEEEDEENNDIQLSESLSYAITQCYNEKLKERARRKTIVKDHALLLRRAQFHFSTITDQQMVVFMQLLGSQDFDMLLEGLDMERMLTRKVRKLRRYRELGITRHRGILLYDKLEVMRSNAMKELRKMQRPLLGRAGLLSNTRRAPAPIDISQFSGYELLSKKEQDLCAGLRVRPEQFIQFKTSLVELNTAEGGVRLMQARQMLKVDVNKTRKLFNFLRDEQVINALK